MTRHHAAFLILILATCGCSEDSTPQGAAPSRNPTEVGRQCLAEARAEFQTRISPGRAAPSPAPDPPPHVFRKITYPSDVGELVAYLTPDPNDGDAHPAIIWVTGGECNTIDNVWMPLPEDNDQTAAAFRQAGIIMMFPSMRGGNDNPGNREGFLGEVDDPGRRRVR